MDWTYKHTNTIGITATTTGSIVSGIDGWNAYGVELRWKSTNLTSAPVTAFVSSTTSVMRPTTTTETTTQVSEEKSSGFSTGSKAGTGVGVGLGATLAILRIGFWILHGRKRRGNDGEKEPSELAETKNLTPRYAIHELDSNPVFEKDGVQGTRPQLKEPVELEGPSARLVDLEASYDLIVPV